MTLHKYVFIVDDDEDDRHIFQTALKEIDDTIKCDFATDGKEALSILKKNNTLPEILFLDLNMPKLNGFECLRKLKNDIQLAQVPVVIFTTSTNPDELEKTYKLGANVFFSKPASYLELKEKLGKILNLNFQSHKPGMDVTYQYAI